MPDNHIKRGFLDDSRLDNVTVRSFEKSTPIGKVMQSQRKRHTETMAEELIEDGKPHEATDTRGEWKEQGLIQCKGCHVPLKEGSPKDEKTGTPEVEGDFRFYEKEGVWYRCTLCRDCEKTNARLNRFSHVIPIDPYPKRIS